MSDFSGNSLVSLSLDGGITWNSTGTSLSGDFQSVVMSGSGKYLVATSLASGGKVSVTPSPIVSTSQLLVSNAQVLNLGVDRLNVSGDIYARSMRTTSDYRVKWGAKELDLDVFSVDALKPVSYFNTLLGKQDIGFLAHEVSEVFPFLVEGEKDGESYQNLNYIGLIGILVREIQELKKIVRGER